MKPDNSTRREGASGLEPDEITAGGNRTARKRAAGAAGDDSPREPHTTEADTLPLDVVQRAPRGDEAQPQAQGPATGARPKTGQQGKRSGLSQITGERPLFTLSVAADLLGLHPRTLRIYEEKGLVVPARTGGNRRRYSQNDIQRFQFIRRLTGGGVNLEGVRIVLDMADSLSRLGGNPDEIIERNLHALDEGSGSEGDFPYDE